MKTDFSLLRVDDIDMPDYEIESIKDMIETRSYELFMLTANSKESLEITVEDKPIELFGILKGRTGGFYEGTYGMFMVDMKLRHQTILFETGYDKFDDCAYELMKKCRAFEGLKNNREMADDLVRKSIKKLDENYNDPNRLFIKRTERSQHLFDDATRVIRSIGESEEFNFEAMIVNPENMECILFLNNLGDGRYSIIRLLEDNDTIELGTVCTEECEEFGYDEAVQVMKELYRDSHNIQVKIMKPN